MDTLLQKVIPLWGDKVPFLTEEHTRRNQEHFQEDQGDGIQRLTEVTIPTLTFFPVSGKDPRPCVVVCPGGGYSLLAWNHEGVDICCWLNSLGFSTFLLKYRCPDQRLGARADAARAIRLIRTRAAEFNIDPSKVGMMGFSAGAHLATSIGSPGVLPFYEPVDEYDTHSSRPDFTALIYPAYLQTSLEEGTLKVSENTPPTLLVQAQDDPLPVESTIAYYLELKKNNIPCEMHLYPDGRHGYGLFRTGKSSENWPEATGIWLKKQGMLR